MEIIAFTLDTIGKLLISYTAIRIHYRFWKEHKIDEKVFKTMRREQVLGILGIVFMVLGYVTHLSRFV